jgi:four helix bundle protein
VWQKAHTLVLDVYADSARFPAEERFGLTRQMRRSAASVAANLAEGAGRGSDRDFANFVTHAFGSATELEYHVQLAYDLRLIDQSRFQARTRQVQEVKRMLAALRETLQASAVRAASPRTPKSG